MNHPSNESMLYFLITPLIVFIVLSPSISNGVAQDTPLVKKWNEKSLNSQDILSNQEDTIVSTVNESGSSYNGVPSKLLNFSNSTHTSTDDKANVSALENNRLSVFKYMAFTNNTLNSNQSQGVLSLSLNTNKTIGVIEPTSNSNTSTSTAGSKVIFSQDNKSSVTANSPPYANAGPDQTVERNTNVTLMGNYSSDKDSDNKLTYEWSQAKGRIVTLQNNHTSNPSFIISAQSKNNTQFEFLLTVTDNKNASDSDSVRVIVATINKAPIANAGIDQTVSGGIVLLNGTASRDPEGDQLTYLWNQSAGPDSQLLNSNSPYPTLLTSSIPKSDKPISLVFALTVDDGQISSKPDNVTIIIGETGFSPATVNETISPTPPPAAIVNETTSATPAAVNETSSGVTIPKVKHLPKSLQIEITTPTEGDKVSVDNLEISGTSTDNDQTDCQVYVQTDKDLLPRKASGKDPSNEDYSTWSAVYNNSQIDASEADVLSIIAELTCINAPVNLTASYAVTVVGSESLEQSTPQKNLRSLHDR